MHISLLFVVFLFLGTPFFKVVANPLEIANSYSLFTLSSDTSSLSEDDIFLEQYPVDDVQSFDLSTNPTGPADLSAENPSCSTDDVDLTRDLSPLGDLWVRNEIAPEEGFLLDSSLLVISAGSQCASPAQNTQPENPKQEEQEDLVPVIPNLMPVIREKERGKCSDWRRTVAACCSSRDGHAVTSCYYCTYHVIMLTDTTICFSQDDWS